MTEQARDPRARRLLLRVGPAPECRVDCVTNLACHLDRSTGDATDVIVRYIADRDILQPDSLAGYLEALPRGADVSVEELAVTVLADINDQVVPRWVRVRLRRQNPAAHGVTRHDVVVEDRQPGWDNASLLSRLPPLDD